jgi:hypothetical protein
MPSYLNLSRVCNGSVALDAFSCIPDFGRFRLARRLVLDCGSRARRNLPRRSRDPKTSSPHGRVYELKDMPNRDVLYGLGRVQERVSDG